jgi:hypothetical protein
LSVGCGARFCEQTVAVHGEASRILRVLQSVVRLETPTRDGAKELRIRSNLPTEAADALQMAGLYRKRWTIEGAFHTLGQALNAEVETLSDPPAALLAFCVGVVCSTSSPW